MADNQLIVPEDLRDFFQANVDLGTEDQGQAGESPILKVVGAQTEAQLQDGTDATKGMLYHTILKQEFKEVEANILYIKKCQLPGMEDKTITKLNYVVGGFLREAKVPFICFVHGLALQPFWDYQKQMNTLVSVFKIPMFAQVVKIGSVKREGKGSGKAKMYDTMSFELVKKDGTQLFETNKELLQVFVTGGVEKTKKMVNDTIKFAGGTSEEEDPYEAQANRSSFPVRTLPELPGDVPQQSNIQEDPTLNRDPDVSSDIPF